MSNPNSNFNYSQVSAIRTATGVPARFGTTVTINYLGGKFTHSGNIDVPQVVFHRAGLALGCTFITNEAMDRLIEVYTDYKTGSRVIQ